MMSATCGNMFASYVTIVLAIADVLSIRTQGACVNAIL